MLILTWKQKNFLGIFFGFLALSLLSPIASNIYVPDADYAVHTGIIVQADMALREGQFPIRIAPWQNQGWGNAFFQFYSPFPYIIAGNIYKILESMHYANPFFVFKSMVWLALFLAGVYFFRLINWLTASHYVALLSSVVYMMAPYFLINIDVRGALTEAMAQGLVPVVLYYTLRGCKEGMDLKRMLCIMVAWFVLITTHLITFVYTSFFLGLFLILLLIKVRDKALLTRGITIGLIYAFSCLLAAWYLIPIAIITKYLLIAKDQLTSPFESNWLTPLSTLISAKAISPQPFPANGILNMGFPLYSAVGWPVLFGVGAMSYLFLQKRLPTGTDYYHFVLPLLILFFIALFTVWSPVDFWQFLPKFLTIAQFSYRLLTQTMWIGILLFSFAVAEIFKEKFDLRHLIIGIFLIGLAESSWLSTINGSTQIQAIVNGPSLGYPANAYLVNPEVLSQEIFKGNVELPLIAENDLLEFNKKITLPISLLANTTKAILHLEGEVRNKNAICLIFQINGQNILKKNFTPGKFSWNIPISKLVSSLSLNTQNLSIQYLSQLNGGPVEVLITSHRLMHLSPEKSVLPVTQTQKNCKRQKATTICQITVLGQTQFVQLPLFYYPKLLLDIRVNGKRYDYFPLAHRDKVLTGIQLPPGDYLIYMKFVGIRWANWLSSVAWLIFLLMTVYSLTQRKKSGK